MTMIRDASTQERSAKVKAFENMKADDAPDIIRIDAFGNLSKDKGETKMDAPKKPQSLNDQMREMFNAPVSSDGQVTSKRSDFLVPPTVDQDAAAKAAATELGLGRNGLPLKFMYIAELVAAGVPRDTIQAAIASGLIKKVDVRDRSSGISLRSLSEGVIERAGALTLIAGGNLIGAP